MTQVHREAGGRDVPNFPKKSVNKNSKSHSSPESPWATRAQMTGAPYERTASHSLRTEDSPKRLFCKSRKENKSQTLTSQGQTREESYLRNKGKALLRGPGGKEVVGRTCSSPQGLQPQMWAALMSSPGSSVCPSPRLTMSVFWKLRQWGSHFLIISFRIQTEGLMVPLGGRKRTKHAQDLGFWLSTAHHPVKERRFWASQITRGFK